jgi:hypothetical protein
VNRISGYPLRAIRDTNTGDTVNLGESGTFKYAGFSPDYIGVPEEAPRLNVITYVCTDMSLTSGCATFAAEKGGNAKSATTFVKNCDRFLFIPNERTGAV